MALTDTEIRKAKPTDKAYRVSDGSGLYLWAKGNPRPCIKHIYASTKYKLFPKTAEKEPSFEPDAEHSAMGIKAPLVAIRDTRRGAMVLLYTRSIPPNTIA